jgi:acetyl-CoA synthetase
MDALVPSLYHGVSVVAARRDRFDPEWAMHVIEAAGVRNVFLPPTALKMVAQAGLPMRPGLLRSIMSGGEPLGGEVLSWAQDHLGVMVNEIYGQTEANYLVGNCASVWPVKPGSMGRPYPGHDVEVHDEFGAPVAPGELGQVVARAPDPVHFLGYFGNGEATREKYDATGEWLQTGDLATVDEEGYLWFGSRNDDLINSAGYRIGPSEVERCLTGHPAVQLAGAIGVPDATRGEVVKAFVTLAEGHEPTDEVRQSIQDHVRSALAAYAYPREIEFLAQMPLTTTGKIRRADLRELNGVTQARRDA